MKDKILRLLTQFEKLIHSLDKKEMGFKQYTIFETDIINQAMRDIAEDVLGKINGRGIVYYTQRYNEDKKIHTVTEGWWDPEESKLEDFLNYLQGRLDAGFKIKITGTSLKRGKMKCPSYGGLSWNHLLECGKAYSTFMFICKIFGIIFMTFILTLLMLYHRMFRGEK